MRAGIKVTMPRTGYVSKSQAIKQVSYGTAMGLNRVALDVKDVNEDDLPKVFDRPTPFTSRAFAVLRASSRRLESIVLVKDAQASYLSIQDDGGTRTPKRKAIVVPGSVKTNKYGNMTRGKIAQVLRRKDTFSANINGTAGIWQRSKSGALQLLVLFTSEAKYSPRFKFAQRSIKEAIACIFP